MNSAAWLAAAVPEPVVCCRVELLPLSIGHLILLKRFGSEFVLSGSPTPDDLFLSVLICSQNFESGNQIRFDDKLARTLTHWGREITLGPKRFMRRRATVLFDFANAFNRFDAYLAAGGFGFAGERLHPLCIAKKSESSQVESIGTPSEIMSLTALMTDLGMSFSEAINFPYIFGRHLLAANSERKGGIRVLDREKWELESEKARQFFEAAEKLEAEL
jgi:hypothetical protein